MTQTVKNTPRVLHAAVRLGTAFLALLCLGLLAATTSSAAYEQVDNFAGTPGTLQPNGSTAWPEEVQLGGTSGMAVNYTGAGGVPKGTLYAATYYSNQMRVARYNPDGSFSEAWTFEGTLGGAPKERCGPDGDPAHPTCKSRSSDGATHIDVDVDQSTGNVYAFEVYNAPVQTNLIHVYTPDGTELIAEFGELAPGGETFAESPGKIHGSPVPGGIAVNDEGHVYVYDRGGTPGDASSRTHRLMKFEPQTPGDYENYVYAGQGEDIVFKEEIDRPVADAAGDIYVRSDSALFKFDPDQPAAPPVCTFKFPIGQILSITVDPLSGEAFFYSFADRKIHVLSPCEEGKFTETGKLSFSPKRNSVAGLMLAFGPTHQFAPDRPAGILYAAAPNGEGGKSEEGLSEVSMGYVFAHPVELPPEVLEESVSDVTATTAALGAEINPKGPPTRYVFQYITQAEYEANEPSDRFAEAQEAPIGGALLGEGPNPLSAAASLSGLLPDTTYHYRAVATSNCSEEDPEKVCEDTGPDQFFRTFPAEAPGLPDRRAYELVSPIQKAGGVVFPADPSISSQCASSGGCKPGGIGGAFPRQSTPDGEAVAYEGTAFSSTEGAVNENQYIARRDAKTGWQTTNPTPVQLASRGGSLGYKAFDTGLTRALIEQRLPVLSPEAPAGYEDLYAQPFGDPLALSPLMSQAPPNRVPADTFELNYAGASADLSRVFFEANDALTAVTAFAPEAEDGGKGKFNLYEWTEGQLALVNVLPGNSETEAGAAFGSASAHAVSDDGSRVFWSDEAGQVYVRVGGEETIEVPGPGKFVAASTDGSKVLLFSGVLYDLEAETSTDLTEGNGGFQGVLGESEDLSHIYFVDTEVLTGEEENGQGAKAQAGKFNLYAWEEGSGTSYVATLVANDNNGFNLEGASDWKTPYQRTAETSPQGRYLAFLSLAPLTGYDNTGPCDVVNSAPPPTVGPGPCPEAFLYDSATGELSCVSCNPSNVPPLGASVLRRIFHATASMPQPQYLTDEGRLYFDSRDSLVPADTNEGVEDVYQYEPNGVGTCQRPDGCVSLLSAGSEPEDSNLFTVDETGKNVFFTTRDQLVLKDKDDLIDLYVAREDGGIPAETEVARTECQGEACVAALVPPNDPTPGSSTFEGAGNVDEKKAQKKSKKQKKKKKSKKNKKKANKRAAKNNRGGAK